MERYLNRRIFQEIFLKNAFPLNKAPGNDGLPIEFYETFWNFLGEPLVERFNTSFVKGEMSSSQRQTVITEKRSRSM